MGFNADMLSGKRKETQTYGMNTFTDNGRIRQFNANLTGGVAYRVLPGVYLQGSVNVLGYNNTKTIWDVGHKDEFSINRNLSLFNGGEAGIILPF
jgi:hypothetical protein